MLGKGAKLGLLTAVVAAQGLDTAVPAMWQRSGLECGGSVGLPQPSTGPHGVTPSKWKGPMHVRWGLSTRGPTEDCAAASWTQAEEDRNGVQWCGDTWEGVGVVTAHAPRS